jgi:hypothetical protein
MRPRFMLAVTLAMGILNLSTFVNLQRFHRLFVAMLGVDIFVVAVSYLVLWFFWKGRNWARFCVLGVSVLSVINLYALIYPHGTAVVYDSIVIAWAILGLFLLYWLNLTEVREWFQGQKRATDLT